MENRIIEVEVTIAFKRPTEYVFQKVIAWYTESNFHHSELIVEDKWISASIGKGITINDLRPLKGDWEYCKLGKIELTKCQYEDFKEWLCSIEGDMYDYTGIIWSQLFPMNLHNRNKWFCSEVTTAAMQRLLIKKVMDLKPHLTSAGTLAKLYEME